MGSEKLNGDDCPPASAFSFQEPAPPSVSMSGNGDANYPGMFFGPELFSFCSTSPSIAHPTTNLDHSRSQLPDLSASFLTQNHVQNLNIDPYSGCVRNNVTKHHRVPESTNCDWGPSAISQPMNQGVLPNGLQIPTFQINSMPPGYNPDGDNQINKQGCEGNSKSLCFPEQLDGNFLTLGSGSDQDHISKKQFSTREVANKLRESVSLESKHAYSQPGELASLRSNANQFSSWPCNTDGFDFTFNNDAAIHNARPCLSSPFFGSGIHHDSTLSSYANSDFLDNTIMTYPDTFPFGDIRGDHDPIPLPFSRNSAQGLHSGSIGLSGLALAPVNPASITAQQTHNHLQAMHARNNVNTLTGSSLHFGVPRLVGSNSSQHGVGKLASAFGVDSVRAVDSSAPGGNQNYVSGIGSLQQSKDISFSRMVVQPSAAAAQAINKGAVPQVRDADRAQTAYSMGQIKGSLEVQNSRDLQRADFGSGHVRPISKVDASQASSTSYVPPAKRRAITPPSVTSFGQRRNMTQHSVSYLCGSVPTPCTLPVPAPCPVPVEASGRIPVPTPNPRPIQAPGPIPVPAPSLRPVQAPGRVPVLAHSPVPVQASGRIRAPRVTSIPPRGSSGPAPRSMHVPPSPLYIRSQGREGQPQPLGHKCLICKRDLSYTPDGAFYQPSVPPPVAVLPCGHTFHDQCLQNIVPQDQSKDPPCIPCALGEA